MKTMIRFVSLMLALVLVISWPVNAYATVTENWKNEYDSVIVFDEVTIASYENEDGDSVICEFTDGVLTQRNIVPHDKNGIVIREYYDANGVVEYTNQLNAFEVVRVSRQQESISRAASGYLSFGVIEYRVVGYEGYEYYTQIVNLQTSISNTTCVIDRWQGTVADLIGIIVGAGIATVAGVSTFTNNLLLSLGVWVVGGVIKNAVSMTVQCTETEYVWQLYDSAFHNTSNVYGYKYYITETGSNYGEIHYDGITPKDWGTTSMAYSFYNASYVFNNWIANKWTLTGGNTNM